MNKNTNTNTTISLSILLLNELLRTNVIDTTIYEKAIAKVNENKKQHKEWIL